MPSNVREAADIEVKEQLILSWSWVFSNVLGECCNQGCGVGVARSRGSDAGFIMGVGADRARENAKE